MSATETQNVVIVGGGPAGLTAALYAARALLSPLVLEGITEPGGQLTTTTDVENFPGFPEGVQGPELIARMREQAERFGAVVVPEALTDIACEARPFKLTTSTGRTILAKTVIVATGASAKYLGLESEQAFLGRGVSACATCDGFFFKDQDVIVVGGGDTALEEAIFLTRFAKSVTIVHRRDELRASKIMQDRAKENPKIRFLWNSTIDEVLGDDAGVTGVRVRNIVDGGTHDLAIQGMFLGIGHRPNTDVFRGHLDMDDLGYLKVKPNTSETNIPGIFAAGDVHDLRYRQAITAAGAGCRAAMDAEKFLEEHEA